MRCITLIVFCIIFLLSAFVGITYAQDVRQLERRHIASKQIDQHLPTEYTSVVYSTVPKSSESRNADLGKSLYQKVSPEHIAEIQRKTKGREELMSNISSPPAVSIQTNFNTWEKGILTIEAEASDTDGTIISVEFGYSLNKISWASIGIVTMFPYSIQWDTGASIPEIAQTVWVKATALDNDGYSMEYIIPNSFKVDNQPPNFGDWTKIPQDLTEDTKGPFCLQVNVDDDMGAGVARVELSYKIFSYYYSVDMAKGDGNLWYYYIPEPVGTWDNYRGVTLYYKARATDLLGNLSPETPEQEELIDSINDPPRATILSSYKQWEKGTILIQAEAIDDDGQVMSVQFQYSVDNTIWTNIGPAIINPPYITMWNTTMIEVDPDVWLRVVVVDNDGATTDAPHETSFGIDNKVPVFSNWTHANLTEDFAGYFLVELVITDAGSGVNSSKVEIKYHIGDDTSYLSYITMIKKTGTTDTWFYEIPKPSGNWSSYAGQNLYYMVRAADMADNIVESDERSEYIEPTTGSFSGVILPRNCWFQNANVTAQQNGTNIKQVLVSQIDGSYSITKLLPGFYDLVVRAIGYGTDCSMINIEVKAGQDSPNHNVELYTYVVADITNSQGGNAKYTDFSSNIYELIAESDTFEGKAVIGLSGMEPTDVANPRVTLLGKAISVGFQGKSINKPIRVIMPRPPGISDGKSIMTFIFDGIDYRVVERSNISTIDTTINITLAPEDIMGFSDQQHRFNRVLSRTDDTVFYILITKFDEPQIASSDIGIRDPRYPSDPNINIVPNQKVALIIPGITSNFNDFAYMINTLKALKQPDPNVDYYDQILVFIYSPATNMDTNGSILISELARVLPNGFGNKIDVISHDLGGLIARRAIINGADNYIGRLIMLGTPHGGVDIGLLKISYAAFLKKTTSNPTWTYCRDGWQDILSGSECISSLNYQPGRKVDTHYYGVASAWNDDGLVLLTSANFMDNNEFPDMELPLTRFFETIVITPPLFEGPEFASYTSHVIMINSFDVINRITKYILTKFENEIRLKSGWSLISFPANKCFYQGVEPGDQPTCVEKIKVDALANWFSSVITPNDAWQMVIGANGAMDSSLPSSFHSLKYMSPCSGYWVKIKEGGAILYLNSALFDPNCPIPLKEGWNLVGCPLGKGYYDTVSSPIEKHVPNSIIWEQKPNPVADYIFSSIAGKYDMIIGEDGAYNPNLPAAFNSLHYIAPGYAYWIKMKGAADLIYP